MFKILIAIMSVVLLSGCGEEVLPKSKWVYETQEDKDKASAFILECLANANPKSDEEPEDWMPICMKEAKVMYGTKQKGFYYWNRNGGVAIEYQSCTQAKTEEEKRVCGQKN